jgi:tRNA threonylcarbamoyladenosine modification (KEOPS) complex  Pcc1 subunit
MPASAKLDVQTKSRRLADAIAKSLSPEIDHPAGSKAHVRVKVERRKLKLTFQARDATALRAVMNSYLRMIGACLKVTDAIDNPTKQE